MKSLVAFTRKHFKAILITLVINFVLGGLSIYLFGFYGTFLFACIPFLLGFLPIMLTDLSEDISGSELRKLGQYTLLLTISILLVGALEGIICIVMALPILLVCNYLGIWFAKVLRKKEFVESNVLVSIVFLVTACTSLSFDVIHKDDLILKPLTTSIVIDSSREEVWNHVVSFSELPVPTEALFQTGLAYPIRARIEGTGVGAVRYCQFNTGDFVEPITVWDKPNLLAFDVLHQPVPMIELSPYHIHPPHLDGYFSSHKGQFELVEMGNNKTELIGTTYYSCSYFPAVYWDVWVEYILHAVHNRVLKHIKVLSERG